VASKFLQHQKIFVFFVIPLFLGILLFAYPADYAYWTQFLWMLPVAFIIALIVNTLGISGAALFVPFFILLFPLFAEPLTAIQSIKIGLITESFGLSSSALAFLAYGLVDKKLALYAIAGALPFVIGGAFLTSFLPQSVLFIMIASLLIVSIILVLFKNKIKERRLNELAQQTIDYSERDGEHVSVVSKDKKEYRYCRTKVGYRKRFFGYGIGGFFQGSAGFGIGELGIISMILSNIPTRISIGTSHVVVASTAIIASSIHIALASAGDNPIPWNLLFITVPAVILGGQIAPYIAAKLPTKLLERFISLLFFIIALMLIVLALNG